MTPLRCRVGLHRWRRITEASDSYMRVLVRLYRCRDCGREREDVIRIGGDLLH